MKLLLQTSGGQEVRALIGLCLSRDIPTARADIDTSPDKLQAYLQDGFTPVGSVEFIRHCMNLLGVAEPPPMSYPASLKGWLHRDIHLTTLAEVAAGTPHFLKPAGQVKLFSGFVRGEPSKDPAEDAFRDDQEAVIHSAPPATPVHVSPVVHFQSEWRYYVMRNKVIGLARYDDGDNDAPMPSSKDVVAMIMALSDQDDAPEHYAIDAGVLSTGQTALVEINDGWALGLYRGMNDIAGYAQMLAARWQDISRASLRPVLNERHKCAA